MKMTFNLNKFEHGGKIVSKYVCEKNFVTTQLRQRRNEVIVFELKRRNNKDFEPFLCKELQ